MCEFSRNRNTPHLVQDVMFICYVLVGIFVKHKSLQEMKVWAEHMEKSSALMSYNVFTFPTEAQMLLHIKIWEVHAPAMFEMLKEKGCTAYSYNQVWNSPGTFKTSVMWEYETPEAFKACQETLKEYTAPLMDELKSTDAVIEASRNVFRYSARAI